MERDEVEAAAKVVLMGVTLTALFFVIGTGSWGPESGFAPTDRSVGPYTDFATDLFVNHGFELFLSALLIAAATLGGLQIAREEEFD